MIHEAELEAKQRLDEAAQQVRMAVAEYERIVLSKKEFIAKIRNLMQTELSILSEVDAIMPDKQKDNNSIEE